MKVRATLIPPIAVFIFLFVGCANYGSMGARQLLYDHDGLLLPKTKVGPFSVVLSLGRLPGDTVVTDSTIYSGLIESEFWSPRADSSKKSIELRL